jgi:glycine oxidase
MRVIIIGAGIVGALLAYELSQGADVVLLDRHTGPAQEATGAALGLLMGIISQKTKGRAWQRREQGIAYYHQLLPRLGAESGLPVTYNPQGLLKVIDDPQERSRWEALANIRQHQGWPLEFWSPERVESVGGRAAAWGVYSPADWQVHPAQLAPALVAVAQQRGVQCVWEQEVQQIIRGEVATDRATFRADWIVVTAGLGSDRLVADLPLVPVLGQALRYQLLAVPAPILGPVITHQDIHWVPLPQGQVWVGATVEFPTHQAVAPLAMAMAQLQQQAQDFFPLLAEAQELEQWWGLRPRPGDRPAPVVAQIGPGLVVATGHYRNGVLLAPATAIEVKQIIQG